MNFAVIRGEIFTQSIDKISSLVNLNFMVHFSKGKRSSNLPF